MIKKGTPENKTQTKVNMDGKSQWDYMYIHQSNTYPGPCQLRTQVRWVARYSQWQASHTNRYQYNEKQLRYG